MPMVTKRYLTRKDLKMLLANPEAFHAFIPNGAFVWVIKEAKKQRSHVEGNLDSDIITPKKRMRLVKYNAVKRKAIWAVWPPGMTVEDHSKLYQKLAAKYAGVLPTLDRKPFPIVAEVVKRGRGRPPKASLLPGFTAKEVDKLRSLLAVA